MAPVRKSFKILASTAGRNTGEYFRWVRFPTFRNPFVVEEMN